MRPFNEIARFSYVHPRLGPPIREEGGCYKMGELRIIASWRCGWDHVSVSRVDRCPTWQEMEKVKRAFFRDDELAMQLHVPSKDHINVHPHCLHIWRPHHAAIPTPPIGLV